MPPSVARLNVEVSGPNPRPNGAAARLRSSWTTPGPDAHAPRRGVDLADRVHVARGVEHEALRPPSGRRGSCPRRADDGDVEARRGLDGDGDVGGVAREGDEQRCARVQARVAREQVAGVGVRAHVAPQLAPELGGELRAAHLQPCLPARGCLFPTLLRRWCIAADVTSCRSRAHQRPGPRAAGDRRADDRPSRAGVRSARPRGARRPARRLRDRRPGRRLPRLRHRRVGGGARQHAVARRQACSRPRPGTSRRSGGRWPSGSGSRSCGWRATGATAPTPSGSRDALDDRRRAP